MQTRVAVSADTIRSYADGWLLAGEIAEHSKRTTAARRDVIHKLLWFMADREHRECDTDTLRRFFLYLRSGHEDEGGRWGNPQCIRAVRPRTIDTYHCHLRTFFRWLVAEGGAEASPMERIPPPVCRSDQVEPFAPEELRRLLDAARKSGVYAKRDQAVLLFMLDTGVRASELSGLQYGNLDLTQRRARVLGKGNKERTVSYQARTARAMWSHLSARPDLQDHSPVFGGQRGAMSRSGILQICQRLGARAGVKGCHPHRFRHTFAIEFLRAGGNQFSLMQILGHTNMQMTSRYVNYAQADIETQQRRHSPVERIFGSTGR